MTTPAPQRPERPAGRGSWMLRDRPGVAWLALAGLVALVHPFVPGSRWLMVHLVLLGALTHSVIVWSTHFTQALLKTPESLDTRRRQSRRLVGLIAGVSLVLVGVPTRVWPLTVLGATLVSLVVGWHGVALWRRLRRALPGRFRVTVRYYLAAAAALPVGATFGATLARGVGDDLRGRLLVAHTMTMLLGWVGLTVAGTLVTLWPTMLRTRVDERAETLARQALPLLVVSVVVVDGGALAGIRPLSVAGLVSYAVGLAWWARALVRPARTAPPRHFATWSVSAGLAWLGVLLVVMPLHVALAGSWTDLPEGFGTVAAVATVGFALQLLLGALSHLVPVVLGGGAQVVRAAQERFDRWAVARVATVNLGLLVCLLPVPSAVRVLASTLVLLALAAFVPLMLAAIKAAVRTRVELARSGDRGRVSLPPERSVWSPGQLAAAVSALAVAVSLGVAWDPAAAGLPVAGAQGVAAAAAPVTPTGHTTRVSVEAKGMRFSPSSVVVPRGDRLVIELTNRDDAQTHDLVFGGSVGTKRLMPGRSATLDVGVVGSSMQGWCSIVGHRQMGMVFDVQVPDSPGVGAAAATGSAAAASPAAPAPLRRDSSVPASFRAVDAVLPPLSSERVHKVTLTIREVELEVAPGIRQKRWTFDGAVPGPTLHGRVGDVFEVTLVNRGSMGHSIDFHAGSLAPDRPMRTIPPGASLRYTFTATRSGIWMYHCSTMPMSAHIAAGMHGAVVIEPPGLPRVDRSYVLVQSEAYVAGDGRTVVGEVDAAAVSAERPSLVTFNGVANQYDARPLPARVGERVRVWVLDAGPNRASSFHVVGGQFDTVWSEGTYLLRAGRGALDPAGASSGGSQALGLQAAQGGFVELTFPEAGHYPFVTHVMVDAERGAHGLFAVTAR